MKHEEGGRCGRRRSRGAPTRYGMSPTCAFWRKTGDFVGHLGRGGWTMSEVLALYFYDDTFLSLVILPGWVVGCDRRFGMVLCSCLGSGVPAVGERRGTDDFGGCFLSVYAG